jgi:hypothetical protein
MKAFKNRELISSSNEKLCETHNGKANSSQKVKLLAYKTRDSMKTYRPLKRKKIKLHKLKFIQNAFERDLNSAIKTLDKIGDPILSKRYCAAKFSDNWSGEEEIINWLASINIKIKRLGASKFLLEDKICSLSRLVVFTNKKRSELGLSPFYVEGITEH